MENLLGKKVKDKIMGLEGIAITKCIYLNGCIQYAIQAKIDKDGAVPNEKFVDEQQLIVMDEKKSNIPEGLRSEAQITEDNRREFRGGGGFRNHPGE